MRIVLLEPFMGGSHALWAEGLINHSRHDIELIDLPGRHWKWRMHGAAPEFAKRFNQLSYSPDLILATDLMDLSVFCGLSRKKTSNIPVALYFHENQLCYPWSDRDPDTKTGRNRHYAFINVQSALAADRVFFSSDYQKKTFLNRLPEFLHAFPDFQLKWATQAIEDKSQVLALGLNLDERNSDFEKKSEIPVIIWNHRWEYDKNPDLFFNTLYNIQAKGYRFELIVCGEHYGEIPGIFAEAKIKLAEHIIHWGFSKDKESYQHLLKKAHIIPVTSNQDFFGISVIEAAWFGAVPLLPNRLAYPAIFGDAAEYYLREDDFQSQLEEILDMEKWKQRENKCAETLQKYRWTTMIQKWDVTLENCAGRAF